MHVMLLLIFAVGAQADVPKIGAAGPVAVAQTGSPVAARPVAHVPDEFIVKFKEPLGRDQVIKRLEELIGEHALVTSVKAMAGGSWLVRWETASPNLEQVLGILTKAPDVEYAQLNHIMSILSVF
jgi:hypothetical protein